VPFSSWIADLISFSSFMSPGISDGYLETEVKGGGIDRGRTHRFQLLHLSMDSLVQSLELLHATHFIRNGNHTVSEKNAVY
jgi:hypothetical protein